MGPARVPALINTPWTHFSAKEMRVRGGPANVLIMNVMKYFLSVIHLTPRLRERMI